MGDWDWGVKHGLWYNDGEHGDYPCWDGDWEEPYKESTYKTLLEWNALKRMIMKGQKGVWLPCARRTVFTESQTVPFNIFYISKKNGKFRRIFSVNKEHKSELKKLLPLLENILQKHDSSNVSYGFIKNKNCVANAMQHLGYNYTISMDVENFFESVTRDKVEGYVDNEILDRCLISGVAQQGLPTSPLLANISFIKCDKEILETLTAHNIKTTYTRYADDLTISFDSRRDIGKVIFLVKQIVEKNGFKLNKKKTKIQNTFNGRVIITGVGIDLKGVHPTRKTRKKLRAANYREKYPGSIQGLEEWCKCKLPRAYRQT